MLKPHPLRSVNQTEAVVKCFLLKSSRSAGAHAADHGGDALSGVQISRGQLRLPAGQDPQSALDRGRSSEVR